MPNSVYDTDKHFVIDPVTREITSESGKSVLIQRDHNSERFTFEIPKIVDGHDMTLCNLVQVHYSNYDSSTGTSRDGLYKIEDLQISPDNTDLVIGSWLISSNATQNVGPLNFIVRFACIDDSGNVEYDWRTSIYKKLMVAPGIDNSGKIGLEIKTKYPDVLTQLEERVQSSINELEAIINGTY